MLYILISGALLLVWVLLPLLPAVLIYRLFPDTKVSANGPLANLTIATSGAFAAFLIVLVVIAPFVYSIRDGVVKQQDQKHEEEVGRQRRADLLEKQNRDDAMQLKKQYWTVEIPVLLFDSENKPIKSPLAIQTYLNSNTLQVDTNPRSTSVGSTKVTLRIVTLTPGEFPMVIFRIPQFEPQAIDLSDRNPESVEIKPENFSIKIKKPISIRFLQSQEAQRPLPKTASTDDQLAK